MADDRATPLYIEEFATPGSAALRTAVKLEGDDAPHGQPRSETGWEEGGETRHEVVQYPGRAGKTYVGLYWTYAPRVFHGALRSHLDGNDYRKTAPGAVVSTRSGRSTSVKEALEALAQRFNLCLVFWGDESFTGTLTKARFEREGPDDYKYELTFDVASVSGQEPSDQAQTESLRTTRLLTDILAELRQQMAARAAGLATLRAEVAVKNAFLFAGDVLGHALDDAFFAAQSLETAALSGGRTVLAAAQRFAAAASRADKQAKALQGMWNGFAAEFGAFAGVGNSQSAADTAQNLSTQSDSKAALDYLRQQLRAARGEARARIQQSTRLYRVQDGDTLESIAAAKLGSRARAADLGVAERDVRPGKLIRLPEV